MNDDNAFAESFIKTLKVEEVYLNEYETFEDAFRNICNFIENVYNHKRLHSALNYRSPVQFEVEVALNTIAKLLVHCQVCSLNWHSEHQFNDLAYTTQYVSIRGRC